jgi:hypothetical protein
VPLGPRNEVIITAPLPPGAGQTVLGGKVGRFARGEVRLLTLTFDNPTGAQIRFSWRVLAGVGAR